MNLVPQSMRAWLVNKAYGLILREGKVYGRQSNNGKTYSGTEREMKLAFEAVEKDIWMYASIYAIATAASALPSGVYKQQPLTKGGDYALDKTHRITNLIKNPNPIQTSDEFIEACFWSLELTGKLFIEVVGTTSNPEELYVLDARRMTIIKSESKFASGYSYDLNGTPKPFALDEIIFHRYHHPGDPHEGLSASTPAGDSINADILSNDFNNEYFSNHCIPAATLETENRMQPEECDALIAEWQKGHQGKKKRHRIAVLYGGVKFNVVQRSPKDMEFIKQKALNRQEILAGYGVPPVLVGLLESVNYSNSKEQRKMFWTQTMRPKLKGLAARLTKEFHLDGIKYRFAFDLTDVEALQEDQEVKGRVAFNLAKAGIMCADEIRRIFYKLKALPDGTGATIWVPTNMVPAKLQMDGPVAAPQPVGKPGKPGGPDANSQDDGKKPGGTANNKPKKEMAFLSKIGVYTEGRDTETEVVESIGDSGDDGDMPGRLTEQILV